MTDRTETEPSMQATRPTFPTDPSGLPEATRPTLPELADGDVFDLRIGAVAKRLGYTTVRMLGHNGSIPGPILKAAGFGRSLLGRPDGTFWVASDSAADFAGPSGPCSIRGWR